MNTSYYDVVVLGTRAEGLLCGALLAKRGFRVLVLGQGELAVSYEVAGRTLLRAPYTFLVDRGPVARRVLAELALHQLFRRRATAMDPAFQVVMPGLRMDLPMAPEHLEREVERELGEVKRAVEDFHRESERTGDALDRLLDRDFPWPPETFLEKREFARTATGLAFDRKGEGPDPLAELPARHAFRDIVRAPTCFASFMDPEQLSRIGTLRLYDAWRRGSACLEGGYRWLSEILIEKIHTASGDVRPRDRAEQIEVRRGTATGVRLTSGETVGCAAVIGAIDVDRVLPLLPDRGSFGELFERSGEPTPRYFRYTLNVVVRAEAVPAGMARDVFSLADPAQAASGENLIHVETHPAREGERLLCVEALLPRRRVEEVFGYMAGIREGILTHLEQLVPFLRQHLILVDSPHDGRSALDAHSSTTLSCGAPWTRGPSTMRAVHGYPVRGALGVCALPVRTPIKRLYLASPQVVPGLGQEGGFLAAWSAARTVSRSNPRKSWMRRGLWTKVEL